MKDNLDALKLEANDVERKSNNPNAGKPFRERIKVAEEAIANRKAQVEEELNSSIIESKAADLQGMLDVAKEKRKVYEMQLLETKASLEARTKELKDIKVASVELDDLAELLKQHEALRARMFAELEAKKLDSNAPARVVLLESAQSPTGLQAPDSKPPEPAKK